MSRMFPFITRTWNPLGGECLHHCCYCWAQGPRGFAKRMKSKFYEGEPTLKLSSDMEKMFPFRPGEFVFVEDMADLFGDWVPREFLLKICNVPRNFPETKFLFLTKNPKRYLDLWDVLHDLENCVLGCTIESNRNYPGISKAPSQLDRLYWMSQVAKALYERYKAGHELRKLFLCAEPILDFDLMIFDTDIYRLKPWAVAIGYDNYNYHLPEPRLVRTMALITRLEDAGITVYRKTLREAWNHD